MRQKLLIHLLLPLVIIGFFTRCSSDDDLVDMPVTQEQCDDLATLGEFLLLDSSKDFLSYPDG